MKVSNGCGARLRACLTAMAVAGAGLLGPAAGSAEVAELSIDPMTSAEHWQVGGRRINYRLGDSSVMASEEQIREGAKASLKLTYDFAEPRRDYISAYHTGEAIPGRCEELSFWLFGNESGCRLRLSIEDARGRWLDREAGVVDWQGWRQVRVAIGRGDGWRALLRRGEQKLPVLHPVNLRQIAVHRRKDTEPKGAIYLHDLRARSDVAPADLVAAKLSTGRHANLFYLGDAPTVKIELTSRAREPVEGRLVATITDFFETQSEVDLGTLKLPPGGTVEKELRYPTERLGTHTVRLTLRSGGRERLWLGRFAVSRPAQQRPADARALFGCCANLQGFSQAQLPTVVRLNRDAGIRWSRTSVGWGEINPAPGVWAWDGPKRVDGPKGKGLDPQGRGLSAPHAAVMDCRDAVTIAFWARGTGPNNHWQTPLQKWGGGNRRNYGVYFALRDGSFCFSASYAKFPGRKHVDHNSGFRAWDNTWHHYAATYSRQAKKVALYVDGKPARAFDHDGGELRTNEDDLVVGASCPAALDDMVLYSRALAPAEVAALAGKANPPASGLIAHWPFEGEGPVLGDQSPNHLDLGRAEPSAARRARLALGHGIKTLCILGFPPKWASTAPDDAERCWVYKPKLDAWAAFVEQVTRRYKDVIQHWEIWNEPNISVFWEPEPSAKEFFDVVKVGYEAAKRGNPDCTVIMPGLAGPLQNRWGMQFLDELLEMGAAKYCDAIAIHPYRQATPEESDLVGDLEHIAEMARKHGAERKLWFTEDCWTTHIPGGSTERRQALMLPRCYVLSLGTGLMERLLWFRLHDPGVDRFYTEHNYGLCYNDLTPKPAYFAHRTVALLLDGAKPGGEWDVGPRALARCFRTPAERVAAVWAPEGKATVSIYVGKPTARLVDLMGNERTAPTADGVLLVDATEAVVFLRGLSKDAEGRGTVLQADAARLARGTTGRLDVRLRNPFGRPQPVVATVTARRPLAPSQGKFEGTIPANAAKGFSRPIVAPRDAEVGWHSVDVSLVLAGRTFAQRVPVAVCTAARDAGPVGHWKLDEGQGTRIADSSAHKNHGTVQQPKWVEGKFGKALEFGGKHIAVIPDAPSLNLRDEVTVAFWIKTLGKTGTWQFPVTKYFNENIRRNYGMYLTPDKLHPCFSASFERGTFRHNDVATKADIHDGQWHHLAATCSMFDKAVRIYVDGEQAAERQLDFGVMLLTTDPVRIGTGTKAAIDDVRVYPRVLSAGEIATLAK